MTLTRTRLFLPRFSSCWATVPTASSSKPWSVTPTPFTPVTRRRSTKVSVRPGSRPSRRSVPHTRLSCERSRSTSTGHSKSESWSTSWQSFECSSLATSSWTSTWTGGTSSSSRWTQTACTLLYPARSSRTPSDLGTRPSSRRKRSVGWPGTSGATASLVYSSSRRRPPVVSHFAASATTWRTRLPARRRCPPRESSSGRTRCVGSVSSGPLRAIGTWWSTEAFECGTVRCTRTSSASSV